MPLQEVEDLQQNVDLMNEIVKNNDNAIIGNESVTVEISDAELTQKANEEGYIVPLARTIGKTKVVFHSWGVEVWLSSTAVKTLGAVGYAGFAWMLGIVIPAGGGALLAGLLAPLYANYILAKSKPLYIKVWYTGKKTVTNQ